MTATELDILVVSEESREDTERFVKDLEENLKPGSGFNPGQTTYKIDACLDCRVASREIGSKNLNPGVIVIYHGENMGRLRRQPGGKPVFGVKSDMFSSYVHQTDSGKDIPILVISTFCLSEDQLTKNYGPATYLFSPYCKNGEIYQKVIDLLKLKEKPNKKLSAIPEHIT